MRQTIRESITPDGILRLSERKRRREGRYWRVLIPFPGYFARNWKCIRNSMKRGRGNHSNGGGEGILYFRARAFRPEQRKSFRGISRNALNADLAWETRWEAKKNVCLALDPPCIAQRVSPMPFGVVVLFGSLFFYGRRWRQEVEKWIYWRENESRARGFMGKQGRCRQLTLSHTLAKKKVNVNGFPDEKENKAFTYSPFHLFFQKRKNPFKNFPEWKLLCIRRFGCPKS